MDIFDMFFGGDPFGRGRARQGPRRTKNLVHQLSVSLEVSFLAFVQISSVADPDPDPPDPHVFGPPGSGFISQRYGAGSESGSGSFYHQAKKNKNLDSYCFVTSLMYMYLQKVISKKTF